MKALVTGMGGFIGVHLAARLVSDGWDVLGTVRTGGSQERLAAGGVLPAVEVVAADLSDRAAVVSLARASGADAAFLLAAARAGGSPAEQKVTAAVNDTSAGWLVDALPDNCSVVVRLGSSTEYGQTAGLMGENSPVRPRGFFGVTKAAGSQRVIDASRRRGMRSAVLRAFQVYGPLDHDHRFVPAVLRAAAAGTPLPLTSPGMRRDWVFIDDVVEACVRVADNHNVPSGQVLNIGTGRQVANEELVAAVEKVTGRRIAVNAGAHPGRSWDTPSWVCDPSLAGDLLGWRATVDLEEGLRRCWEAYRPPSPARAP